MKAKQKAEELSKQFKKVKGVGKTMSDYTSKQCALICVDEKEKQIDEIVREYNFKDEWFDDVIENEYQELRELKQELNRL